MSRFARPEVQRLHAYEEEAGGGLNLMANTNLFGPNPAIDAALVRMKGGRFSEYPTLTSAGLRAALGQKLDVDPAGIVTGNGSNDLIDVLCRTFLSPGDRVAYHWPCFSMIPVFLRLNHGVPASVPLGPDWALDPDALVAADGKLTFVVRPNNPTGNAFPRRDVERIVDEARGVVVLDEAYVEFLGGESFVKEVREGRDNLIVLRTFSKAHGMAGLRVGYSVSHPDLAREMTKVRGPFRLDTLAETAATIALADDRYLEGVVEGVRAEKPNLKRLLEERGFHVFRSDANFLLAKPPVEAKRLAAALAEQGVHVRDFGADLAPYLRITVGPPAATARLRVVLDDVIPKLREASA
ncbi:MAG: histidinol-phosphate aminotransferase [Thermoplasmata archaeon]|nr:histidinol-phosphate aminotransferase [Thermoplasmata archaeon]